MQEQEKNINLIRGVCLEVLNQIVTPPTQPDLISIEAAAKISGISQPMLKMMFHRKQLKGEINRETKKIMLDRSTLLQKVRILC